MARLSRKQRQELWQDRLERYSRSDLTVAQFCQRENISAPSFYNWKRRLATTTQAPPQRSSVHRGFAEVLVGVTQTAQATLPGGITISLGTDRETVTLIVDRLLQHAADQRGTRESDKANSSC